MSTTSTTLLRGILVITVLTLGLFGPSSVAATEPETHGEHFGSVTVPDGLAPGDVQEAIVNSLLGRQWGIKSKSSGEVVAYLKHRSNEATVTLLYDTTKVEIYCVGYKIDKDTGDRKKPELPKGWLKNIQRDVTENLNKMVTHK